MTVLNVVRQGEKGEKGATGAPGEVTAAELAAAVAPKASKTEVETKASKTEVEAKPSKAEVEEGKTLGKGTHAPNSRLTWDPATQLVEWQDVDVIDLREYTGVVAWRTDLGANIGAGSKNLTNSVTTWTVADVGKTVILKLNTEAFFQSTIVAVAGGVAELAAAVPAAATNQRQAYGRDETAAIQAAMAEFSGENLNPKILRLVGYHRVSQLAIPPHLWLVGAEWGSYGSNSVSNGGGGIAGTLIQQLPGAQKDLIVFQEDHVDSEETRWVGPVGICDLGISGPETIGGVAPTVGSGLAARNAAGQTLTVQDGFYLQRVHSGFFPGDGFAFPGGGVPLYTRGLRAFYNAGYGINYTDNSQVHTQGVHFLDCSGDGNSLGLLHLKAIKKHGEVVVTNLKSEKANILTPPGAPATFQENAIVLEDCEESSIVVNGVSHISSVNAGGGVGTSAPGPAILIKSATDLRPVVDYAGVICRLTGVETANVANAVTLRDSVIGLDITQKQHFGIWPPVVDSRNGVVLAEGDATMQRREARDAFTVASGQIRLGFLTAQRTEMVSQIRVICGTGWIAPAPTVDRLGVFVINNAELELIAATAHDTTLLSVSGSTYTKALTAPFKKYAGRQYVVGVIIVTAGTAPAIQGFNVSALGAELALAPQQCAVLTGQANFPEIGGKVAGYVAASTEPYMVMIP